MPLENKEITADEEFIIDEICKKYPNGITLHTQGTHPCLSKAQQLCARSNRPTFESSEELRIVNDVIFEGVLNLPGFLAWTAFPLALAHYGGKLDEQQIANELLDFGDLVSQLFSGEVQSERFVMKPEQLKRWFNEQFRGKTIYERLFNVLKVPSTDRVQVKDLQRVA